MEMLDGKVALVTLRCTNSSLVQKHRARQHRSLITNGRAWTILHYFKDIRISEDQQM